MWSCGKAPFGYKKEDKKLVIDPREAEIVRTIFESFVANPSICALYHKLKEAKMLNRSGFPLSKTAIYSILKSIVHAGIIKNKGAIYQCIHQPIISIELFNEVQAIRKNYIKPKKMMS